MEGCPKDNIFAERDNLPLHESGGARQALPGFFYQFQLLMVWILEAVKSSFNFYISTEDDKLGKFDDFGFYKIVNDEEIRTFIQVKSKQKEDYKLPLEDFFSKQINLVQYFESFVNKIIKNDPDAGSDNTKLILYTNCGLEFGSEYNNLILREEMFEKVPYNELFNAELLKFKTEFEGREDFVKLFLQSTKYKKSDVENFLSKFYIVLNGEKMSELEHKIKQYLEMFVSKNNVEKCYYQYYSNFQDWYKSKKGTKIDSDSILRYFQTMKDKITQKLHFNLLSPNINFYGRSEELKDIENNLISNEKSELIDIAITGTAGVGKSELARKCAQNLNDKFQHILWLNAESKETLNSSFIELAKYLGISVNEKENINSVIRNVYDYLRDRNCLFIFDNAELYFASDFSEYISTLNKNHKVILTSQKQDWPSSLDIQIDTFLENDAVQFLSDNLNCDDKNSELLTEIVILLSCLPLALQLAVAYIKNMMKRKQLKKYTLQDFYVDLTNSKDQFLSFKFSDTKVFDHYKKSIYLSWQLALNSLASEVNGDKAIEILQIMSYLQADNIPIKIFFDLCGGNENVLDDAIYLLKSYSLIKCEAGMCSIHRLLQDVIRTKLQQDHNVNKSIKSTLSDILNKTMSCVFNNFKNLPRNSNHILSIWNYIKDNESLRNKYIEYDFKLHWSHNFIPDAIFQWSTEIMESYYEFIKYRLIYVNHKLKSRDVILEKYYTLNILSEIAYRLRNFKDIIILFEKYFKIEDFSFVKNREKFIDILCSFSYFYYKNNEYDNSILLINELILLINTRNEVIPLDFKFYIYEIKIDILIWQNKYVEALEMLSDIESTLFFYVDGEKYTYFELYSDELKYKYLNLFNIVEGPDKCIKKLKVLSKTCNIRNKIHYFNVLVWIAKFYLMQGNLKSAIDLLTKIFTFLLEIKTSPDDIEMHKLIYGILVSISETMDASFKPGSLTKLCEKIKCFLLNCKMDFETSETKLRLLLANLFMKNGDYSKAIKLLEILNIKNEIIYKQDTDGNISYNYRKSICDIAMMYHLQGETQKSIEMIDKYLNEDTTDQILFNMMVNTKADILLLINKDEAINFLLKMISFIESKYPSEEKFTFELKFKAIQFTISQGKYDEALENLEKLLDNVEINSWIYIQICKKLLDMLELKCKYTKKFFDFFEKYIIENNYNSFYKFYFDINKIKSNCKYANSYKMLLEIKTDKFKGDMSSIRMETGPFNGNDSQISEYLILAYLHYLLEDYDKSLQVINDVKHSRLLFLEYTRVDTSLDFYRFEKLIHYRKEQKNNVNL